MFLRDRRRKILDQLLRVELPLVKIIVIDSDRLREVAFHGIRRHLRPVKPALDIDRFVYLRIDAHAQAHAVLRSLVFCQPDRGALHELLIILPVRAVNHEGVR